MVPKRSGKIIATASIMAFRSPAVSACGQWYAAAKAGVVNLVRALGVELAERNIQINAIAPRYTRTGIRGGFLKVQSGPDIERIENRTPIRRLAEPEEYKGRGGVPGVGGLRPEDGLYGGGRRRLSSLVGKP